MVEYAWVPLEDRTDEVGAQRDLAVAEALGRPFYRPQTIRVGTNGRLFVLDGGNHRIVVLDARGKPLVEMGGEGQGPGELRSVRDLGLLGDLVLAYDDRSVRWSVYRDDGTHVADYRLEDRIYPGDTRDAGGRLLMVNADPSFALPADIEAPPTFFRVGFFDPANDTFDALADFEYTYGVQWEKEGMAGTVPLRAAFPRSALGADRLYVTDAIEYQVRAIDLEGNVAWALRTDYVVPVVPEEVKRAIVELLRESMSEEGLAYQHFHWPDRYAAIENLEVDGHGHLWVFPHADRGPTEWREANRPVPVDVYSRDGELLFSGMSPIEEWDSAFGDHVYLIETDPGSAEELAVRYRLVEPF